MGAGFDFRFQLFKSSEECVPSSAIAAFTDMGASDVGFNKYLIVHVYPITSKHISTINVCFLMKHLIKEARLKLTDFLTTVFIEYWT